MKRETIKKILELALYLLLLTACILLIINYILFKTDAGECVRDTKQFLIEHFEETRGGNITCTCKSDIALDKTRNSLGGGGTIIFSSHGYDPRAIGYNESWKDYVDIKDYPNMSIE